MTYQDFSLLYTEAAGCSDLELYIAEWATSSLFCSDADADCQDLAAIASKLEHIWDLAHMSLADLCRHYGLTQTRLAAYFGIPLRTVQDWHGGRRKAPDYVLLMMIWILEQQKGDTPVEKTSSIVRKYLVLDERLDDVYVDVYDTAAEANRAAEKDWQHLTPDERKIRGRRISVWYVENTPDYLVEEAWDEETGEVDFSMYHSLDSLDEWFDSARQG